GIQADERGQRQNGKRGFCRRTVAGCIKNANAAGNGINRHTHFDTVIANNLKPAVTGSNIVNFITRAYVTKLHLSNVAQVEVEAINQNNGTRATQSRCKRSKTWSYCEILLATKCPQRCDNADFARCRARWH